MTGPTTISYERLPERAVEAAIDWALKLDETPPAATRAAFDRWLARSPDHALAWARISSLRGDIAALPPALARDTLDAAQQQRQVAARRRTLRLLASGAVLLGAGWGSYRHTPWQRLIAQYSTATGMRGSWQLADGTLLALNTDSAASSDLRGEQRVLTLHRGEALIETGADPGWQPRRPFWLHTPFGKIQALGTRFVVRLDDTGARVGVQEGAVALHPRRGGSPTEVRAGESRWLLADATAAAPQQGFAADDWYRGALACQDVRMAELLSEFERYRFGRILCDARVAGLRVSGVFHVDDIEHALQTLALTQPVRIERHTRYLLRVLPQVRT